LWFLWKEENNENKVAIMAHAHSKHNIWFKVPSFLLDFSCKKIKAAGKRESM
jgi:tRNA(Phe) wybutosine-synthesizing methylase Tyw3